MRKQLKKSVGSDLSGSGGMYVTDRMCGRSGTENHQNWT